MSETLAERRRVVVYLRDEAGRLACRRRYVGALLLVNLASRIARGEHLHPTGLPTGSWCYPDE